MYLYFRVSAMYLLGCESAKARAPEAGTCVKQSLALLTSTKPVGQMPCALLVVKVVFDVATDCRGVSESGIAAVE